MSAHISFLLLSLSKIGSKLQFFLVSGVEALDPAFLSDSDPVKQLLWSGLITRIQFNGFGFKIPVPFLAIAVLFDVLRFLLNNTYIYIYYVS